jgi:hypothetical protein
MKSDLRATGTDKCDGLTLLNGKADPVEGLHLAIVGELHVAKLDDSISQDKVFGVRLVDNLFFLLEQFQQFLGINQVLSDQKIQR